MSQDRIAALHFLVTAQVGEGIANLDKFAEHAKKLGPSLGNIFKEAKSELTIYDKELERIMGKVGRGSATPNDLTRLSGIQEYVKNQATEAPVTMPAPAGGYSPAQLMQMQAWRQQQEMIQQRVQLAQYTDDYHARTRLPEMYGPQKPDDDFFRQQQLQQQQAQDAVNYQNWLRQRATATPMVERIEQDQRYTQSQENVNYQNWLRERASGPSTAERIQNSQSQDAVAYQNWLRQRASGLSQTEIQRETIKGSLPKMPDTSSVSLNSMNSRELSSLMTHFRMLKAEGRNVTQEIDRISSAMLHLSVREETAAKSMAMLTGNTNASTQAMRRFNQSASQDRLQMGAGSDVRRFRYAAQNVAYGFEDAMVSYQLGGTKAAARAAGNNISALASLIPNPYISAGAIAATAVGTTVLPGLIDYVAQVVTGKDETEALTESINKLFDAAKAKGKLSDIIGSKDLKALDGSLKDSKSNASQLQKEIDILREQEKKQREVVTQTRYASKDGYSYGDYGNMLYGFGSRFLGVTATGLEWAGLPGVNKDFGKFADDQVAGMSADKNRELIQQMMKEKEAQLQIEKDNTKKIAEARYVQDKKQSVDKKLEEMQKDFYETIQKEQRTRQADFTPEEFKQRQKQLIRDMNRYITNEIKPNDSITRKPEVQEELGQLYSNTNYGGKFQGKEFYEERSQFKERYEQYLKQEQEAATKMQKQLLKELNPRAAIEIEYADSRTAIRDNKALPQAQKDMLLALTDKAERKALEDFDKPKNQKPTNEAMDVGSRADAEMRQKFMSGRADDAGIKAVAENQLRQQQRMAELLNQIEKNTGKKPGKAKLK